MAAITYLAGAGAPQVDTGAQSHTQHVQRRPVHQVEVEIVLELRSIQDFERNFGYFACGFPWRPQKFLTVKENREIKMRHRTTEKIIYEEFVLPVATDG